MAERPRAGWALWIPVAAAAVVAGLVAAHVSAEIPFDSDEANHANLALRQFQDLRDGRFTDFLRHSYRTGQFPFLHGWSLLPWFAVLGTSAYAARVAQCAWFVLGTAAAGWAAFRGSGDDRRAGAVAAGLFATSPFLASFAGLCMLETPGAAATALTLAFFAEACRADGPRAWAWHAATAAAALATYFVKLNFGLWILPAVGAGHLVLWLRSTDRKAALRGALVYAGVVAVVLAVWYSRAEQRAAFMSLLHNPSQEVSVERDAPTAPTAAFHGKVFLEYFPLLAKDCHAHWIVGAAAFLAFAWGARRTLSAPVAAACVACVAWTWLVLSMGVREYALTRFMAAMLPALWIVAGIGAADVLARVGRSWLPVAGAAALALGVGVQFARLPALLVAEYETDERFVPLYDFLVESVPPKASVMVVGCTDHTNSRMLDWCLATKAGAAWRDHDVRAATAERVYESPKVVDDWLTKPRRWGEPSWDSVVVEIETGPRYMDMVVLETARMWRGALAARGERLQPAARRRFEDLDVTATVWRDTAPPPHLGTHAGD
jgi:4-amino-4-deoxy-L-arabinose transferase-like glycosyltransferase